MPLKEQIFGYNTGVSFSKKTTAGIKQKNSLPQSSLASSYLGSVLTWCWSHVFVNMYIWSSVSKAINASQFSCLSLSLCVCDLRQDEAEKIIRYTSLSVIGELSLKIPKIIPVLKGQQSLRLSLLSSHDLFHFVFVALSLKV